MHWKLTRSCNEKYKVWTKKPISHWPNKRLPLLLTSGILLTSEFHRAWLGKGSAGSELPVPRRLQCVRCLSSTCIHRTHCTKLTAFRGCTHSLQMQPDHAMGQKKQNGWRRKAQIHSSKSRGEASLISMNAPYNDQSWYTMIRNLFSCSTLNSNHFYIQFSFHILSYVSFQLCCAII